MKDHDPPAHARRPPAVPAGHPEPETRKHHEKYHHATHSNAIYAAGAPPSSARPTARGDGETRTRTGDTTIGLQESRPPGRPFYAV